MYFSYHNRAKKLIREGLLTKYEFVERYNGISPALVLHFGLPDAENAYKIMPVREERWAEYMPLIAEFFKK